MTLDQMRYIASLDDKASVKFEIGLDGKTVAVINDKLRLYEDGTFFLMSDSGASLMWRPMSIDLSDVASIDG